MFYSLGNLSTNRLSIWYRIILTKYETMRAFQLGGCLKWSARWLTWPLAPCSESSNYSCIARRPCVPLTGAVRLMNDPRTLVAPGCQVGKCRFCFPRHHLKCRDGAIRVPAQEQMIGAWRAGSGVVLKYECCHCELDNEVRTQREGGLCIGLLFTRLAL